MATKSIIGTLAGTVMMFVGILIIYLVANIVIKYKAIGVVLITLLLYLFEFFVYAFFYELVVLSDDNVMPKVITGIIAVIMLPLNYKAAKFLQVRFRIT